MDTKYCSLGDLGAYTGPKKRIAEATDPDGNGISGTSPVVWYAWPNAAGRLGAIAARGEDLSAPSPDEDRRQRVIPDRFDDGSRNAGKRKSSSNDDKWSAIKSAGLTRRQTVEIDPRTPSRLALTNGSLNVNPDGPDPLFVPKPNCPN